MKTYTVEEKKTYRQSLRDKWLAVKKSYTQSELTAAEAIIASHGLNVSGYSFMFTAMQMKTLGYEGLPYLDCKTYQGWKDAGFQVMRGEKSRISGVTWIGVSDKKENSDVTVKNDGYVFPKEYHLFHRSQVEAI